MKILGVGLGRTGTFSLHRALKTLGYQGIHWDTERLTDVLYGRVVHPNFRVYDDVDCVTDEPAAFFYRELLQAYPSCRAILTVRDEDDWWRSTQQHHAQISPRHPLRFLRRLWRRGVGDVRFRLASRRWGYGSATAREYLYRKRFREHNERVQREVPAERLLVMNICAGDGWGKLCPFLSAPVPSVQFPCNHQAERG